MIYLDFAAATPLDSEVFDAMQPFFSNKFYNASAGYLHARAVAKDILTAREKVAKVLGSRPAEIVFTAGGTEANNLAIQGIMQAFPDKTVLVSSLEHDSVLHPARNYTHKEIKASSKGVIDFDDLRKKIDDDTVLISIMYANNEIGTIQPLADVAELIKAIRKDRKHRGINVPLYFHTDACQAGNFLHLLVDKLGVDLMTINAGKLYGPKQAGALYVKAGTIIKPQILGGGQERGMRSGTENPAACIGFAHALVLVQGQRTSESKRLNELRQLFIERLLDKIASVRLTVENSHVLPNNVHITIQGQDNERLMMALDEAGVICAVGSACSASSDEPSHVLKAIGLTDADARSSLRFTMGRTTTRKDIEKTVDTLAKLIV